MRTGLIIAAAALAVAFASGASAGTPEALYGFCQKTDCKDGRNPTQPLSWDSAGNLYAISEFSSAQAKADSILYTLTANGDGTYSEKVLWKFCPRFGHTCRKPSDPRGRVAVDPQGNVFGVTTKGDGGRSDSGVFYELSATGKIKTLTKFCATCQPELAAHARAGMSWAGAERGAPWDGISPLYFATTRTLDGAGGIWAVTKNRHKFKAEMIWQTTNVNAVAVSDSGVVFYLIGDDQRGGLFKLVKSGDHYTNSQVWTFCAAHTACNEGSNPLDLTIDATGNIYGTTTKDAANNSGAIWKLAAPNYTSMTALHAFCKEKSCVDGNGSSALNGMTVDGTGNVYGSTPWGGNSDIDNKNGFGTLFKISGGSSFANIYKFCNDATCTDGHEADGGVTVDQAGNLFGTTIEGGPTGAGMVYRFTP